MADKPLEPNSKIPLNRFNKSIKDYRSKGDEERLKILEGLYLIRSAKGGFLKREKDRLVRKLGSDHPRIQRYINKEKNNMLIMENLRHELVRSRIDFSAFDKNSWNICGHVRDSQSNPVHDLIIQLFDADGKLVKKLNAGRTDMTGFFTIIIPSKRLKTAEIAESTQLYIRIFDKKKKLLFKDPNPLYCRIGQVDYREIFLPKEATPSTQTKPGTPEKPKSGTSEEPKSQTSPFTPPITPSPTPPRTQPRTTTIQETKATTKLKPGVNKKDNSTQSPIISPIKTCPAIDEWIVKGSVMDEKGNPLKGVTISLYDNDHIYDNYLGAKVTDAQGHYEFTYKAEGSRDFFEKRPDVFLKITDKEGKVLPTTKRELKCSPGEISSCNVKITPETKKS